VASPPTGTLTFLFTDIEGSTRLWERHPEAMQIALARHDEILRATTEQHGGYRSDLQLGGGGRGSGRSRPAVPRVSMLGGTRSTLSLSSNSFYRLLPALARRRQTSFRILTLAERA
jgi:class 3 adenylate cyclase